MRYSALLAAGGFSALLSGVSADYILDELYEGDRFFDKFNFFTGPDPTHGFVNYVDRATASAAGMVGPSNSKGAYMGVDSVTMNPQGGRKSVRIESARTYNKGLFIADISHMPSNKCGTWPAFWLFGPSWPQFGEIDIIEGVNTQSQTSVTLHTSNGCTMSNKNAVSSTYFVSPDCGGINGCGQHTADNQNYGDGFNAVGGGVYAMDWTDEHIAVWYFPRFKIPQDIAKGAPNPSSSEWGKPIASFSGNACSISSRFQNQQIVFNTAFCGDWAGSVWNQNSECKALASTCEQYVASNPGAFKEAFWDIKSLKVYKQSGSPAAPQLPPSSPPQPEPKSNPPPVNPPPANPAPPPPVNQPQPPKQPAPQPQSGRPWNGLGWAANQ